MTLMAETITLERLEELLADDSISTVHRTLWLLLWEGEVSVLDLLALDVREVNPEADFSERAAGMLRELIGDRDTGPVFADGRRALSWERAMQVAREQGHGIHAFRTGGKRHRQDLE
jgi:hypothetical protein